MQPSPPCQWSPAQGATAWRSRLILDHAGTRSHPPSAQRHACNAPLSVSCPSNSRSPSLRRARRAGVRVRREMAKFFKKVAGTPEESLLCIDSKHAPTTCTCFLTQNVHNCTITRATCTLGNQEYQRQLQQQETNTLSPTHEQDCSEKPFLCICGELFPTVFALNLHIADAPPGSIGHLNHAQDWDLTSSYSTPSTRTPLKEWSWHSRKEHHHIIFTTNTVLRSRNRQ